MSNKIITILILSFGLFTFNVVAQNIGINSTGAVPDASALLDLNSTDKGFLITRVDTANITSPAFGLMTLAPSDSCLYLFNGTRWMGMGGGGTSCSCNCNTPGPPPAPTFPCGGTVIPIVDVTTVTGKTWMDRNLGASQVATSSADAAAYGDLYQWGRCSDGHEKRTSGTTPTLSATDTPGHGNSIVPTVSPFDWRNPQNVNLWQGVNGVNNPCPTGYRLPTYPELDAERLTWATNDAAGAFASPLKLTVGGEIFYNTGLLNNVGLAGNYWSSDVQGTGGVCMQVSPNVAALFVSMRAYAFSVRCIKN